MTRANEKICDVLVEAGIDHVFGIPGGATFSVFHALFDKQDKIKVVLTRHEHSAACMADMYGRLTGKPGVLAGQGAFIASNGGLGIMEGLLYGSPMLVITDTSDGGLSQHGNYQSGTGEYGSFDIVNLMRSITKYTTYAVTPEEAAHGVQLAIKHSMAGRPGPAAVLMRNSAVTGEINPQRNPLIHPTAGYLRQSLSAPPADDVEQASRLLLEAQHPVIIAGSGVHGSRAYDQLKQLAEYLGIPVATSYKGKSAFPETHPLALGMMGGFGQKVANSQIAAADLILAAGCRLTPSDTKYENHSLIDPSRQKIIQIDNDPRNAGWSFPVEMSMVGDLKTVISQVINSLMQITGGEFTVPKEKLQALDKTKSEQGFFEAEELYSNASPLLPQRIVKEIENAVDDDTLITLDAGNNRIWMAHFFKSKAVGTVFCPGGIAGMGWSPPAALTAKLLHPDKPVLSVAGDGGFGMVPHVLSTAKQYELPVVFLVMNNSVLGNVRDNQKRMGKVIASEFIDTDFAQIARAFGCQGINVKEPAELAPAIKQAFQAAVPTVIDVATESEEPIHKVVDP